ncbi:hypothetical protein BU52_22415 [Streptomyces toyocaensis]|uniref:Uncharacterized protein n=1 Tax=Streptomyces toyocaensis TaxID=55952 RepID=A0A081XN57_STRTO|nr:hypothetical protein [Streptomyces toyocaensis]KES04980.1 hypothetical protein BU52_22415 [Streptomyces toyocaensis]
MLHRLVTVVPAALTASGTHADRSRLLGEGNGRPRDIGLALHPRAVTGRRGSMTSLRMPGEVTGALHDGGNRR